MGRRKQRFALGVTVLMAMVLAGASFAWACTPQATIVISPDAAPSGSRVTVNGNDFSGGTVTIRWNSESGPVLGTAQGPTFSKAVVIPDAPQDTYLIVAVNQAIGPFEGMAKSAAFTITAPQPGEDLGQQEEPQNTSGGSTSGTASGAEDRRSGSRGSSGSASGSEQFVPSGSTTASGSGSEGTHTGSTSITTSTAGSGSAGSAGVERKNAGPSSIARTPQGSNQVSEVPTADRKTVVTSLGEIVFGGSVAPRGRSEEPNPTNVVAGMPSEGSAFDNVWAGFDSVRSLGSLSDPVPGQHSDGRLTVGMLLLAVGLVSLAGGMLVAQVRRRRAGATS